jgi:hypothetical protein
VRGRAATPLNDLVNKRAAMTRMENYRSHCASRHLAALEDNHTQPALLLTNV